MNVLGIDEITYGADDLPLCRRFLSDWGLALVEEREDLLVFETMNGCRVVVRPSGAPELPAAIEAGPTLREVVWGVKDEESVRRLAESLRGLPGYVHEHGRVGCTDPNGL